jgi:class 3 adenylate cyclase
VSAPETLDAKELALTNERLRDQQRAVSNVLRAVARSEGLQPVLDEIVESATLLCAGDNGRLWLVKDGLLRAAAQYGSPPETYEYDVEHPHSVDRSSLAGRVALTHAPVHIPDILADPDYTYPGPRPYRAMLGVPVLIENDLIGVVAIVRIPPAPFDKEHIELVRTFADQAAIAIANARLIDAVERQRTELSRFVSPQVAELLSNEQGEQLLAGHRAYISCLFCDLRGFTAFAETAAPEELLELLREYHAAIGELIPAYDGTLEHFAGDGLMVFFNDPVPVEDHALKAIRMALAAQARFDQLADTWRKRGSNLGLGIGIAAGYATLGRIGFEGRYDYGALGPVTNLASRLSTHAEPGQILISQRVFADVEDVVDAEPVGEIELKGFGRPVVAYDVRGPL